jgi:hypothetical protein
MSSGHLVYSKDLFIVRYTALTSSTSEMLEVINIYCVVHNMSIESKRATPMVDDHVYDLQDPLAQFNHKVSTEFSDFPVHA